MTATYPTHLTITGDDTVAVHGERGQWVVGAIRPIAPFSHLPEHKSVHVLVTRVTGRREITATSMWVDHKRVSLLRKGNADADALVALLGEDPTAHRLPYALGCSLAGHSSGVVITL